MAAKSWGLECLRYEISKFWQCINNFTMFFTWWFLCNSFCDFPSVGDISPPRGVRAAMEMQAEAERKKRAQILESEGNPFDIPNLRMLSLYFFAIFFIMKLALVSISFYWKGIMFLSQRLAVASKFYWYWYPIVIKQEKDRLT